MSRPPRPRTTTTRPPYVTPQQLSEEPERAIMVTLRGVLDVTTLAPVAAHPLLLADDWPSMPDRPYVPLLRLAHRILTQADALRGELDAYTAFLDRRRDATAAAPCDDFPF
ncbi:MAG: hypothetical protein IPL19_21750 [Sandaracinaceae bacterium]|nr:hypothetical protein [Sandaracinaceae bacterium]